MAAPVVGTVSGIRSTRRWAWSIGGALALAVLIAAALPWIGSGDRFKPRFETAASAALGMEVRVAGPLTIGLFPGPHLLARDCRILAGANAALVSIDRVRLDLAPLPLLMGRLRLSRIELSRPAVVVVRGRDRRLNVSPLRHAMTSLGTLDGARVVISDGTVAYTDQASPARFEATGIGLELTGLEARGVAPTLRKGIALVATVTCREFRSNLAALSAIRVVVTARNGRVVFSPMTLSVLGGQATGRFAADLAGPVPSYRLACALPRFRVERFPGNTTPGKRLVGEMSFSADLAARGGRMAELIPSVTGAMTLHGADLVLEGNDIDRTFARYESSQNFSLVDLGAVFFAGPAGLAISRGYGFAGLLEGNGGRSRIGALVSDWTLDRGTARVRDVAMATDANRVALQGSLDLVHERFENVTLAVIDAGGCARLRQTIRGGFANPVVGKPTALGSLAGPAAGLYRRARAWFPQAPCVPFYSGAVPAPR